MSYLAFPFGYIGGPILWKHQVSRSPDYFNRNCHDTKTGEQPCAASQNRARGSTHSRVFSEASLPSTAFVSWSPHFADAVGMRARTGQLAAIHNKIFLADQTAFKPAFQDFSRPSRVTGLCR